MAVNPASKAPDRPLPPEGETEFAKQRMQVSAMVTETNKWPGSPELADRLEKAGHTGTTLSVWADVQPDKVAVVDPSGEVHSFAKVNRRANQLVRLLRRRGLKDGDSVALLCSNRAEVVEVLAATLCGGFRLTPVNWHLTEDEIAYILRDCEARAVIAEAKIPTSGPATAQVPEIEVRLAIDGEIAGFEPYAATLDQEDGSDIEDPVLGNSMMYTSGTTGRPKGVFRPNPVVPLPTVYQDRGYDVDSSVQMCAGPAYHAAPLVFDIRAAMGAGVPLVFLDKWDSEEVLRTISERKVTHMHLVPIMFQRLLALSDEVKAKYPVDHTRFIIHGAAPCPPEVKQGMIDWFGPILTEYYAGSEGGAGYMITSEEWLRKPGSVGKRPAILRTRILDKNNRDVPDGQAGAIYMEIAPGGFTYYKDDEKTQSSRVDNFFTMGDIGFIDEDGYLFLTGRSAETIISGGVNIYPQEIDNVLIQHEAVADSSTVGVPHPEWGEEVRAVIVLKPGYAAGSAMSDEILALARKKLPGFKVPRQVDFVDSLPRSEAGKIQRGKVRAKYWQGQSRQI